MSDETTTQEVNEEPIEQTPAEETPAITEEQVAAYLGIDVTDVKQAKNLAKWTRDLNARSTQMPKAAPEPTPAPVAEDEEIELDEKAKKVLNKLIQEQVAPLQAALADREARTARKHLDSFAESCTDVSPQEVYDLMDSYHLWPASADELPDVLKKAREFVVKSSTNVDDIVARKLEEKLKELQTDGSAIIDVKPKRAEVKASKNIDTSDFWATIGGSE